MHDRELFIDGRWRAAPRGRVATIADPATGEPVGIDRDRGGEGCRPTPSPPPNALCRFGRGRTPTSAPAFFTAPPTSSLKRLDAIADCSLASRENHPGRGQGDSLRRRCFRYYAEEGRRIGGFHPGFRALRRAQPRCHIVPSAWSARSRPGITQSTSMRGRSGRRWPPAALWSSNRRRRRRSPLRSSSQCFADAGPSGGVLNDLPGSGPEAGAVLAAHPDVRMITATASTAAGKSIMRAASDTLKRLSLELGGQCPFVVLDDANVEEAAAAAARRSFSNMGQICITVNRIIVVIRS